MKTFINQGDQGDVHFRRIDRLPEGVRKINPENGVYVIAHSESGHNHEVKANFAQFYEHANDNLIAYLVVDNEAYAEHMKSYDTHETIKFSPGVYEIRRQREYTSKGFRRAID